MLGRALKRVIDQLPDGGRALVVGHSPTNEAAVLGVTGTVVAPLGKGEGVTVIEQDGKYTVEAVADPSFQSTTQGRTTPGTRGPPTQSAAPEDVQRTQPANA